MEKLAEWSLKETFNCHTTHDSRILFQKARLPDNRLREVITEKEQLLVLQYQILLSKLIAFLNSHQKFSIGVHSKFEIIKI